MEAVMELLTLKAFHVAVKFIAWAEVVSNDPDVAEFWKNEEADTVPVFKIPIPEYCIVPVAPVVLQVRTNCAL